MNTRLEKFLLNPATNKENVDESLADIEAQKVALAANAGLKAFAQQMKSLAATIKNNASQFESAVGQWNNDQIEKNMRTMLQNIKMFTEKYNIVTGRHI